MLLKYKKIACLFSVASAGTISYRFYKKNIDDYENSSSTNTKYEAIICGAGTSGCIIAYYLAKWMEESNLPGKVLLLERGQPYIQPEEYMVPPGPHPSLSKWYENWGAFALPHDTEALNDTWFPYSASSHSGVGGCGAHDTRISFVPTNKQSQRYSDMLALTREEFDAYKQTILNLIPIETTARFADEFFEEVVHTLSKTETLSHHDYKSQIVPNSIGYAPIAIFKDETRWTSAYLMEGDVRPKNLEIKTGITVDKVLFDIKEDKDGKRQITATGVNVVREDGEFQQYHVTPDFGEVVLAVGALGVPSILQRSGIGPKDHLEKLGIKTLIDNEEVGHGVDHIEVAVSYEFLDKWKNKDGTMPSGGPMGWPLVLFQDLDDEDNTDSFSMCHFGISPPPYVKAGVLATVNVTQPDDTEGFHILIKSTDPSVQAQVIHSSHENDFRVLSKGIIRTTELFEVLREHGVVGNRNAPPKEINLNDKLENVTNELAQWFRSNAGTAYHWMSTCKSGINGAVADNQFIVRGNNNDIVKNLRVGSGACLPQISEANPHMTISIFGVILAHKLLIEQGKRRDKKLQIPSDIKDSQNFIKKNFGKVSIKRVEEVKPDLREIARNHAISFAKRE